MTACDKTVTCPRNAVNVDQDGTVSDNFSLLPDGGVDSASGTPHHSYAASRVLPEPFSANGGAGCHGFSAGGEVWVWGTGSDGRRLSWAVERGCEMNGSLFLRRGSGGGGPSSSDRHLSSSCIINNNCYITYMPGASIPI